MKSFVFTNNWTPKIELDTLTQLGSDEIFDPKSHLKWLRDLNADHKNNLVQFNIDPAINDNDVPEESQLAAINFIINNEEQIYQNIYTVLKEMIYPYYSELIDEDLFLDFPLDNIDGLPKVLGLIEIQVNQIHENGLAWCTYIFEWEGEQEHGLSMLFEGDKFLKHDSAGDMWFENLVPKEELELLREEWNKQMPPKLYYPNPKLRSYKPWQLESTKDYLITLLKNGKEEEFTSIVSSVEFDVKQKFPEDGVPLVEHLVDKGFLNQAKYIHELGADLTGLMHFGNLYYENSNRIEFVKMINGNIDELNDNNSTLLERYLSIATREFRFKNLKSMDLYEKHIKLLLKYGAKLEDGERFDKVLDHMNIEYGDSWLDKLF